MGHFLYIPFVKDVSLRLCSYLQQLSITSTLDAWKSLKVEQLLIFLEHSYISSSLLGQRITGTLTECDKLLWYEQ